MNTRAMSTLAGAPLFLFCISAGQQQPWRTFTSTMGFSVTYPATWYRIGLTDRLDIRSSESGAEGVGIRHGQAEIIATELRAATLSELMDVTTRGEPIISRKVVKGAPAPGQGCDTLTEIISKDETGPQAYVIDTGLYCEIRGRKFSVLLRNWEGDQRQEQWQRIVLQVARSLRLTG